MGGSQTRRNCHVCAKINVLLNLQQFNAVSRCSNPHFKVEELAYQLQLAKVTFMIVHPSVFDTASQAARFVGLPSDRMVLLDRDFALPGTTEIQDVAELIAIGKRKPQMFYEQSLSVGEGNTKTALLSWSSGTTGNPKVILYVVPYHLWLVLKPFRPLQSHIAPLSPISFRWRPTIKSLKDLEVLTVCHIDQEMWH